MKKIILIIVISLVVPQLLHADTIYLKDKTVIEGNVFGEDINSFFVKKRDGNYSVLFQHHEIKKKDIFAIIDESMMLIYPDNLNQVVTDVAFISELTDREYQAYQLECQIKQQEKLNQTVSSIKSIMFTQLLLVALTGIVIASIQ